MTTITHTVGKQGGNRVHDVMLIQTMLKHVKNKQGKPYLAGKCDGRYGNQTGGAITAFQKDHVFVEAATPAGESLGLITPNGISLKRLSALLPAKYHTMRIIPNTKTVYLGQPAIKYVAFHGALISHPEIVLDFKIKAVQLTAKMWHDHGIVLSIPPDGARRPFALQAAIYGKPTNVSQSGAGESHHQYGYAVDIGFNDLEWFNRDGKLIKDNHWLDKLKKVSDAQYMAFWNKRNDIAFALNMYKTNKHGDFIHLQNYKDEDVSMGKSLAEHLKTVSKEKTKANHKWSVILGGKNEYFSDYGLGGAAYSVGTAEDIAKGSVKVEKANLAAALNAKLKKDKSFDVAKFFGEVASGTQPTSYTAAQIKDSYVKTMLARLFADFKAADEHWMLWKPIPKK